MSEFPQHRPDCPWVTHDERCSCGAAEELERRLDAPQSTENDYLVHDDVPVKAECIHMLGCSCLTVAHGVAWEDRLNIICLCGQVCSASIGKNLAGGFIGHPGSDTYVRTPAAQAFADHMWEMNHSAPSEISTPPGQPNGGAQ